MKLQTPGQTPSKFRLTLVLGLLLAACSTAPTEAPATLDKQAAALPGDAKVCFYEDVNYQGRSFCASDTRAWIGSAWNDRVSSVRVKDGFRADLFENAEFRGRSLTLSGDAAAIPRFNDLASSFRLSSATGGANTELDRKCTPTVKLQLEDTARGKLFLDVSGSNPEAFMQDIGRKVCRTLYQQADEIRSATSLTLILRYDPGAVAWKSGDGANITVMISTAHLQNVKNAGRDVGREIKGILFHEMTHMYQQDDSDGGGADSGLIEGIADTVRFKNGFIPDGAQPNKNGRWNDGYRTTAFFLLWVDQHYNSFIYKLNLSMSNTDGKRWSPEAFRTITGRSVDQLWNDYRND